MADGSQEQNIADTRNPREPTSPNSSPQTSTSKSLRLRIVGGILVALVLTALFVVVGWYLFAPGSPRQAEPVGETGPNAAGVATTGADATEVAVTAEAGATTLQGVSATALAVPSKTPLAGTPVSSAVTPGQAEEGEDLLLAQAEALTQRSKFEEATAIYEALAERLPEDVRVEAGWAWTLLLDARVDDALSHARRAVELDPTSSRAAVILAQAQLESEDPTLATDTAEQAVQLDPESAEAHAVLAEALLAEGRLPEAVEEAELALNLDGQSAAAHRVRGWLYQAVEGDVAEAAAELQTAAALQPELWLRRHEAGLLLLQAQDYTGAIETLQDALQIRAMPATHTAIARAHYELGQYESAQASLQQALDAGAHDLRTQALAAAIYAHLGQCDDARPHYEQALALDPSQALALEASQICATETVEPGPSATAQAAVVPTSSPVAESIREPQPVGPLSGRLAFPVWNRERGKYDVFVSSVDGSDRRLVVEEMHQPAFSPDGQWLAVNGERHEQMNLFVLRSNGSALQEVSKHIEDSLPDWSADGRALAFSSTMHGDKQSRVYVMDPVPFEKRQQEGRALNFGPDDVRGESPAWVGGDRIVYKGCDNTVEPARCGLFIMPAAPGAHPATQLTEYAGDTAPATHGEKIAFMSDRDANWEVYVMNEDGSGLERLTRDPAHDGLPAWSPDGKQIAFVSNKGGAWAIWAMSPDGSNRRKLFDIGGGGLAFEWQNEQIAWAP